MHEFWHEISDCECDTLSEGADGVEEDVEDGLDEADDDLWDLGEGVGEEEDGVFKGEEDGVGVEESAVDEGEDGVDEGEDGVSKGENAVDEGKDGVGKGENAVDEGEDGVGKGVDEGEDEVGKEEEDRVGVEENGVGEDSLSEGKEDGVGEEDRVVEGEDGVNEGRDIQVENRGVGKEDGVYAREDDQGEEDGVGERVDDDESMDAIGEDTVTVDLILEYCKTVWEKRQCQNYLICSSFGTKIWTKHIKDLKTKVADEVLDCCFMGLIKQEQSPMQYVSCAVMKVMFSGEQHAVSEFEFCGDTAFGVLNHRDNHWILLVFYHHLHRIWVLDPLGELPATLKEILQLWKSYMAVRPEHQHRWKLLVKPHPKQLDSSSCGVFCVQFAEKILKGEPLKFPQDADSVVSYRLKMLQLIAMNQDPIEDICRLCGKSDLSEEWIGCDNCPKFWVHFNCLSKQVKTIRGQKYSLFAKKVYTCCLCH